MHPLHSTKDYIECSKLLFNVFKRLEENTNESNYLNDYIISIIINWPGQVNIRRAITLRINEEVKFKISQQILNLIPMISLLHISFNNKETLFQTYHFFFEKLYHNL